MEKLSFGQKPKVLVVGAGPIGLAAALEFANFEIETLVVDELSEIIERVRRSAGPREVSRY